MSDQHLGGRPGVPVADAVMLGDPEALVAGPLRHRDQLGAVPEGSGGRPPRRDRRDVQDRVTHSSHGCAQNSRNVSRRCACEYSLRTSPRRCSVGTSPSQISLMYCLLTRMYGALMRKPSPPTPSIVSPIFSAICSGVPTSSMESDTPPASRTSWRSVLPLPHWANLSSEPRSPFVSSCG